jgi:hypothetical protein
MENENTSEFIGKKIFFLNTSPFFQNEIGVELIQQEFEIYYTNIHANLKQALKKFSESVVFVCVNKSLPEKEWEACIRGILADPGTAGTKIGVLTESYNEQQEKKYTETLKLPCGYTVISKPDPKKTVRILNDMLVGLGVKRRRKYIRAASDSATQMTVNIFHNGFYLEGKIGDISSVGISCTFQKDSKLEKNTLCENMQIRLRTAILKADGIVFGSRDDGMKKVYVFLFTRRLDPATRAKIHFFIHNLLQERMTRFLV